MTTALFLFILFSGYTAVLTSLMTAGDSGFKIRTFADILPNGCKARGGGRILVPIENQKPGWPGGLALGCRGWVGYVSFLWTWQPCLKLAKLVNDR